MRHRSPREHTDNKHIIAVAWFPYGVIGVLMAGILGWLLGKSMLETRGLYWAWFIHFCQDVLIFAFLATGMVAAGGR